EWRSVLMVISSVAKANAAGTDLEIRQWLKNTLPGLNRHVQAGVAFLGSSSEPAEYTALLALFDQWFEADEKATEVVSEDQLIKPATVNKQKQKKPIKQSSEYLAMMQIIQQTKIGSWFEFDEPDGKTQRVKLSWYSPVTNNHMFIDRFGYKAFILPTEILVTKLVKGSARVVEPNRFPFVDQTLNKIYGLLRN
ncbi:MAG: DUF1631 domain-containing protein, partial [Sedimenticola sp.]|nr:DUF1631 domain-containing protein [Sedimenticola sp.]